MQKVNYYINIYSIQEESDKNNIIFELELSKDIILYNGKYVFP